MMDNATFRQLPSDTKLAYVLGVASRMLGRETVISYYRRVAPLVEDMMGHGDVANPKENYWDGIWQVYRAD